MGQPILGGIRRYPVKSMAGEEFNALEVVARGFSGDRDWMLVDPAGEFLSQRKLSRMALIGARLDAGGALHLSAPGMPELAVDGVSDRRLPVRVWGDTVTAVMAGAPADDWLGEFLQQACHLVRFPDDVERAVDPDYASAGDRVGFADGFPFLLISQGSLDGLNGRLQHPVSMTRFRPNLVVDGCEAHAEDGWRRIRIGDTVFRVVKPCSRCIIPTIDPVTAERGREPLQTLMTYRRRDNKVYFGQNLIHDGPGRLELGMPVEVLE